MRKKISNLLILSAFGLLLFTYYPIIILYLNLGGVSFNDQIKNPQNSIYIPKIEAYAPIIDNVDPWNETEYTMALTKGVALSKGFSTPDQPGIIYIFAHSSDYPWNMTRYNTAFFKLNNLSLKDEIKIKWKDKIYSYKVKSKQEVWPNEVDILKQRVQDNAQLLILQTCTPIGTALKRLIVFAEPTT